MWEQTARDAWRIRNPLEWREPEPQVRPLVGGAGRPAPSSNESSLWPLSAPWRWLPHWGCLARRTLVQWWSRFPCVASWKIGRLTRGEGVRGQLRPKCERVCATSCAPRAACRGSESPRLLFLLEIQPLNNLPCASFFPVNFPGLTTTVGLMKATVSYRGR